MNKLSTFILASIAVTAISLTSTDVMAQVGKKIDSTAKKVGDKTASTAVKGVAVIKDKVYKGKQAPDGSAVYIDNKDKKYYIDKTGKKIYLKASQIKNKEE